MDPLSGGHAAGNFPFYGGTQGAREGPQEAKVKSAALLLRAHPTTPATPLTARQHTNISGSMNAAAGCH